MRWFRVILAPVVAVCLAVPLATAADAVGTGPVASGQPSAGIQNSGETTLVWGKTVSGESFSYIRGDARSQAAAPAAITVAASCSLTIRNIWLNGHGSLNDETLQVCSGAFGTQFTRAKVIRSSWRGWLDYSSWGYTWLEDGSWLHAYWSVGCHWGGGTYDYRYRAQGYASRIGWSGYVTSGNYTRKPCGSTA